MILALLVKYFLKAYILAKIASLRLVRTRERIVRILMIPLLTKIWENCRNKHHTELKKLLVLKLVLLLKGTKRTETG